jgi:hypothetical protein
LIWYVVQAPWEFASCFYFRTGVEIQDDEIYLAAAGVKAVATVCDLRKQLLDVSISAIILMIVSNVEQRDLVCGISWELNVYVDF